MFILQLELKLCPIVQRIYFKFFIFLFEFLWERNPSVALNQIKFELANSIVCKSEYSVIETQRFKHFECFNFSRLATQTC